MSATLLTSVVTADGKPYGNQQSFKADTNVLMASPDCPPKIPTLSFSGVSDAPEKFYLKPSVGTWMMLPHEVLHRHLHDAHTAEALQLEKEEEVEVPSNGRRSSIFVEPVLKAAVEAPDLIGLKITYTATSGVVLASEVVGRVVGKVIAKQNDADIAKKLKVDDTTASKFLQHSLKVFRGWKNVVGGSFAAKVVARVVAKVVTQQNGAMASDVLQPSLKVFLGWKNIVGSSQNSTGTAATADVVITSGELFEIVAQVVAAETLENSTPPRRSWSAKASEDRGSWSPPTPCPTVAPTGNAKLSRRLAVFTGTALTGTSCGTNREPVDDGEVDMTAVRSKWEKRAAQERQQQWANGCAKNRKGVNVYDIATKPSEFGPFQYAWEQHVQTPLPTHLQNERKRLGIDEDEWSIRLSVTDNEGFFLDLFDPLREDQFPAGVSWAGGTMEV